MPVIAPPSGLPAISPTRGEISRGNVGVQSALDIGYRTGAAIDTNNLPPCGGDGRQARGGCCRANLTHRDSHG